MRLFALRSASIQAFGWENDTLAVRFRHGPLYHYAGVSEAELHRFLAASSRGGYLRAHIIPHYQGTRIAEGETP